MGREILFVDDEKNILNSLTRLFRNERYKIFTALSGEQGLKIIEENEISLVVSDQMMPGMTGLDFLAKIKDLSPDTIRIMLTGHADLNATIAAINKGEVYRFITKPWNEDELLLTIRQSLECRDLTLENKSLSRKIKRQSYLLNKLKDEHPGIAEVLRDEHGTVLLDEDTQDEAELDKWLNLERK